MRQEIISKIKSIAGRENCLHTRVARDIYGYDSSPFVHLPDLVVFAESTEQVAAILGLTHAEGIPLVPRGAGTCLSGGAVAFKGGISLVLTRMNKILDIDVLEQTALVETGVVNQDLQNTLAPLGFMFAPDPASQKVSTLGGNIGECAGGMRGVKHGVTKNHVLGLEVVLADGHIVQTGSLAPSQIFGPDMTGIFSGSEGTFGVITKAEVRLTPLPASKRTAMAAFSKLEQAGQAVSLIIAQGIVPTTLELMDQTMLKAVDDFLHLGFPQDAEALLLVEIDGEEVELDRQLEIISTQFKACSARSIQTAANAEEREKLWLARRSGNGALGRIKPAYMVQDVAVPRHRLPQLLQFVWETSCKYELIIAQMAHAGDGNLHPHLMYDPADADEYSRVLQAGEEIFRAALDMGGTVTGEHGIGLEKLEVMELQFTAQDLEFMQCIKSALDRDEMLNPGKVLPGSSE